MRRRSIRERGAIPKFSQPVMNPFVDVVFLVLIYFIATYVAGDIHAGFDVALPGNGTSSPIPKVHLEVAEDGYVINGSRSMDKELLERTLSLLADLDTNQMIVIVAKPASSHQQLVDVLDICAEVKFQQLAVSSAKE